MAPTGLLDGTPAVRRLLDRLAFGPRPGDLDAAARAGFDATAAALLAQTGADAPGPALGSPARAGTGAETAETKRARAADGQALVTWWLDRMAGGPSPFVEKLTWFWHGHFATGRTVRSAPLMLAQNQTQRRLGAGGFGVLAAAMAVDPAMLVWLNGNQNRVGSPNENLGRELMELFTIGVGHYTEDDVKQAARALTGWTVDRDAGTAALVARRHDPGPETVVGTTVSDTSSLVAALVARPESARFVATRLWARLVSAASLPDEVAARLVTAYGPGLDVGAMLRALVAEPAFRDPASVLVKQPVEWFVGLVRALGLQPSTLSPKVTKATRTGLGQLGQVPFDPPSVGGWPAGNAWLTTGAALARLTTARALASAADLSSIGDVAARDRAEAVRARLGVDTFTARTTAALGSAGHDPATLVAVAACAPEYTVSR